MGRTFWFYVSRFLPFLMRQKGEESGQGHVTSGGTID